MQSSTDLSDQLVVLQLLPALHDSHDARLDLVLSVLVNLQCTAFEKINASSLLNKLVIIARENTNSTFFLVSFLSGSASPALALACWIFTRWNWEVNACKCSGFE